MQFKTHTASIQKNLMKRDPQRISEVCLDDVLSGYLCPSLHESLRKAERESQKRNHWL